MNENKSHVAEILAEFNSRVDEIFGLYVESACAMARFSGWITELQQTILNDLSKPQNSPKTVLELDELPYFFGDGPPDDMDALLLYESSQGEVKRHNSRGGRNERAMSRALIVETYQLWEDHYRKELATATGKGKSEIVADIFGDLRILRRSVIHNHARAIPEIYKCKIVNLEPNEEVYLSESDIRVVIREIRIALEAVGTSYYGHNLGFSTRHGSSGHTKV